jgi:hypothetical protein
MNEDFEVLPIKNLTINSQKLRFEKIICFLKTYIQVINATFRSGK